jgi:hypothetical protein
MRKLTRACDALTASSCRSEGLTLSEPSTRCFVTHLKDEVVR